MVPQAAVIDAAFSRPPGTYTSGSEIRGASLLLLELPGFLSLGVICVRLGTAVIPVIFWVAMQSTRR